MDEKSSQLDPLVPVRRKQAIRMPPASIFWEMAWKADRKNWALSSLPRQMISMANASSTIGNSAMTW
jgi:hypothetical protein